LAGANRRRTASSHSGGGIITAEEIAAMDLEGVEWAVLSACETGVGKVLAGEGVFGLRRAFQVAGARTVIMSLWPVDDSSTEQWMTELYRERFAKRLNTAESVRAANLASIARRRAAGVSTHPFYWSGFIAVGDWR
jgi:CHAT domain-containing protein